MPYGYGYMYGADSRLIIALIAVMVLGFIAQAGVQNTFKKYAKIYPRGGSAYPGGNLPRGGIPANEVALELLRQGNSNAQLTRVSGQLTDHFNPRTNVVGLSEAVYDDSSISALAVAAHEIGHVMQYQGGYGPIRLRNAVLPVANFGSRIAPFIVIVGLFMGSYDLAIGGVILFSTVLLFQLVTLPVEFNASRRGIEMLEAGGYIEGQETGQARKVLRAAAFTYVVAVLATLVSLVRLLLIARNSRRN